MRYHGVTDKEVLKDNGDLASAEHGNNKPTPERAESVLATARRQGYTLGSTPVKCTSKIF